MHSDTPQGDVLRALEKKDYLRRLAPESWEALLIEADLLGLAGRIAWDAAEIDTGGSHTWLAERLLGVRLRGETSDRAILWELDRIATALADLDAPVVALKGAAYLLLELPWARGRRVSDVDVLVRQGDLDRAEAALLAAGWEARTLNAYDERYYRLWTHELPPMVHPARQIPLDLHHGLVPRTSRIRPDAGRVFERSRPIKGSAVRVPCPSHLVVHAAVHLFHDGEIAGALRDLADIDGLLRSFGAEPGFWDDLSVEAVALDASRATFYALRYASRVLATPVPAGVWSRASRWAPARRVLQVMDALVERALLHHDRRKQPVPAALLRARAHWLRMPPGLLARHLVTKAVRRWRESPPEP
jgi:hypothetical protein